MSKYLGRIRKKLFGLSDDEVSMEKRGFDCASEAMRTRLETIGRTFLRGYHAAMAETGADLLAADLETVPEETRGFAYEGAAMALYLLDVLCLGIGNRFEKFVSGPGSAHIYMAYIGAGWAMARLCPGFERRMAGMDPLVRYLTADGFGFHEGFFHPRRSYEAHRQPRRLKGYSPRAFDQGLGRAMWFAKGADAEKIETTIAAFPTPRHDDLWGGVGLAATYAGGRDADYLKDLMARARDHAPTMAQGAAFAAEARERAGNPTPHTDMACQVFCGMSAREVAELTRDFQNQLEPDSEEPRYQVWRAKLEHFFRQKQGTPMARGA